METSTGGPTSRTTDPAGTITHSEGVNHTATLLERHHITIPVGATGDNVAVARLHAEAWARAHGFDIAPGSFQVLATSPNGLPMRAKGGTVGVAFEVVVGKGDIHQDQRVPGVLDTWTWSQGQVERVGKLLANVIRRDPRRTIRPREDGVASVTALPGTLGPAFGDPTRPRGLGVPYAPSPAGDGIDAPTIRKGEWHGPSALAHGGPVPGQGAQHGTGELPPWLRRSDPDFEDPDADEDDRP